MDEEVMIKSVKDWVYREPLVLLGLIVVFGTIYIYSDRNWDTLLIMLAIVLLFAGFKAHYLLTDRSAKVVSDKPGLTEDEK